MRLGVCSAPSDLLIWICLAMLHALNAFSNVNTMLWGSWCISSFLNYHCCSNSKVTTT